ALGRSVGVGLVADLLLAQLAVAVIGHFGLPAGAHIAVLLRILALVRIRIGAAARVSAAAPAGMGILLFGLAPFGRRRFTLALGHGVSFARSPVQRARRDADARLRLE